ncbi:sensor histidine kinase, partial [Halobellus sp. Atlit-38R]
MSEEANADVDSDGTVEAPRDQDPEERLKRQRDDLQLLN